MVLTEEAVVHRRGLTLTKAFNDNRYPIKSVASAAKQTDSNSTDNRAIDLSRVEEKYNKAIRYLTKHFNHGWWSYKPGGDPSTETTAWCSIALRDNKETAHQVRNCLVNGQNADGGWTTSLFAGKSDWTSALALLAVRILCDQKNLDGKTQRCLNKAFNFLFDHRTEVYTHIGRLVLFLMDGPKALNYARGWPWSDGCFHWVEPTSYSLLSLKLPGLPEKPVFAEIIKHANAFLTEHICQKGGWNHGNVLCLGVNLPPYTVTTAEALLALQDIKKLPAVKKSIAYLRKAIHQNPTAMAMSWSALALHAHGYMPVREIVELMNLQHDDGSFGGDLMVTGLATTALGILIKGNPLKYN